MNKFKVGDKVVVVDYTSNSLAGLKGTVVYIDSDNSPYLVDLGGGFDGHSGDGNYHKNTCWWFKEGDLELVKTEEEPKKKTKLVITITVEEVDV